jgi:hypothetical protein
MMVVVVISCLEGVCGGWIASGPMPLAECLITSQRYAAKWQLTHPNQRIDSVNCTLSSLAGTET